MTLPRIGFIGGGNMARSLIGGLIDSDWPAERLAVSDPDAGRRQALAEEFGVAAGADNRALAAGAEVVVIAVKPPQVGAVAREIAPALAGRPVLVLSVAAGVRSTDLVRWLGEGTAVVRAMPNTPALVGSGAAGLYANPHTRPEQRDLAESILRAVGVVVWVEDEGLLDAVTAVSGSGPAYFFYIMEALEEAGRDLGLAPAAARLLAVETALGSAKLALESGEDPAELRRRVTSPGGTTERALEVMEAAGIRAQFVQAVTAARDRARELAERFGED